MASMIQGGIALVVGVIILVVVANVINSSTNAQLLGDTANTIVGFIVVGIAIALFVAAFGLTGGKR